MWSISFLFLGDTEPCGLNIHLGGAEMEGTALKVNHSLGKCVEKKKKNYFWGVC